MIELIHSVAHNPTDVNKLISERCFFSYIYIYFV